MHKPKPKIYDLAETSTFGILRGQNVRGQMSWLKHPWPKCPWPKCPTFEGIGARSLVVTSMKFGYAFENRCAFIGNHAHAGSVQRTT